MKNHHVICWLICVQVCYHTSEASSSFNPTLDDDTEPSYNQLIRSLRDNWQSPVTYLENRGYMPPSSIEDEKLKEEGKLLFGRRDQSEYGAEATQRSKPTMDFLTFPQISDGTKLKKQSNPSEEKTPKSTLAEEPSTTEVAVSPSETTEGFMSHMKDKILNIFGSGSSTKSTPYSGDTDYGDYLINFGGDDEDLALSELNGSPISLMYNDDSPKLGESPNLSASELNSYDYINDKAQKREVKNIFIRSTAADASIITTTVRPTAVIESSVARLAPTTVNPLGELLKNFSRADMEYVSTFLRCFKETKSKFPIKDAGKPSVNENTTEKQRPSDKSLSGTTKTTFTPPSAVITTAESALSPRKNSTGAATMSSSTEKTSTECVSDAVVSTGKSTPHKNATSIAIGLTEQTTQSSNSNSVVTPYKEMNITLGLDINQSNGTGRSSLDNSSSSTDSQTMSVGSTTVCTPTTDQNIPLLNTHTFRCTTRPPDSNPSSGCSVVVNLANKLRFMAHLHHMVDEVGKPPHKCLDLSKVQDMIDKSRQILSAHKTKSVVLGKGSSTQCTPLQLNDMSFDLELNPQLLGDGGGKLGKAAYDEVNNIFDLPYEGANNPSADTLAARFLKELPRPNRRYILESPYADNFLEQQQKTLFVPVAAVQNKKRRAISDDAVQDLYDSSSSSFTDSEGRKMSKVLSDISSSLGEMNSHKRQGSHDDYLNPLDNSEDDNDGAPWDEDHEIGERRGAHFRGKSRVKGKRRRKKPKNKKFATENGAVPENVDITATEDGQDNADDVKLEKSSNEFDALSNIQFHVNPDQEEDIAKFISNLDEPPQIFNFDVDKYLRSVEDEKHITKLNNDEQAASLQFEQPEEARTFYEFVGTPDVEKEKVPLIDRIDFLPTQVQNSEKLKKSPFSTTQKRDLLRQFIKGVSNSIAVNHYHDDLTSAINNEIAPIDSEKPARSSNSQSVVERTNDLINNYRSDFDASSYMKQVEQSTETGVDPDADYFIDNYYVLNDGSLPLFDSKSSVSDAKITPNSVDTQLDLDKKFRDLPTGNYDSNADFETKQYDESPQLSQQDYYSAMVDYGNKPNQVTAMEIEDIDNSFESRQDRQQMVDRKTQVERKPDNWNYS